MPFEKGHSIGRPKGSSNKETKAIRAWIQSFLENNLDQYETDLKALNPKDRITALNNLMEYAVPKLARQEITDGEGNPVKLVIVKDDKQ